MSDMAGVPQEELPSRVWCGGTLSHPTLSGPGMGPRGPPAHLEAKATLTANPSRAPTCAGLFRAASALGRQQSPGDMQEQGPGWLSCMEMHCSSLVRSQEAVLGDPTVGLQVAGITWETALKGVLLRHDGARLSSQHTGG